MYQRANQHAELNRLISAMAISKPFRRAVLQAPERALERGYLGYRFNLTAEETEAVTSAAQARNARQFSLRLWAWMNRQTHESGCRLRGRSSQKEIAMDRLFALRPTNRRADMKPLILVVDDNKEMVEGLRYALELERFRVAHAFNGEGALRFLEQTRPDLILSDIKMPRMDGFALLRLVKEKAAWADVPFIFVTAAADWREAVLAKSLGADEYVVKPFELEDLIAVVHRLVDARDPACVEPDGETTGQNG
jgi:CheY-like chemotaxis protein